MTFPGEAKRPLPAAEQVDETLVTGLRALIEAEPLCIEVWGSDCPYDDEPYRQHICCEEIGHEGPCLCPCGAERP